MSVYDSLSTLVVPPSMSCVDGDDFALLDTGAATGPSRIIIFGCEKNFDAMSRAQTWLADGTFKIAPSLWKQVFTVHCCINGFTIPVFYALLPNKKPASYRVVWEFLLTKVDINLSHVTLMMDFEKASYETALEKLPGITIGGCYFHLKQAMHRNLQELGLAPKYNQDKDLRFRMHRLGALAFLPADHIPDVFDALKSEWGPDEQLFLGYFERTWVGKAGKRAGQRGLPQFSPTLWSVHDRVLNGQFLTNNAAEAFHGNYHTWLAQGKHPPSQSSHKASHSSSGW